MVQSPEAKTAMQPPCKQQSGVQVLAGEPIMDWEFIFIVILPLLVIMGLYFFGP